jgi:hypothetical protein
MVDEVWRTIPFAPKYEVSDRARVRRSAPGVNTFAGRIKATSTNTYGYHFVGCYDDGKRSHVLIHRAVYEAFVGPIPAGMQINHLDGVKTNNAVSNLEIVTPAENSAHAAVTGLAPSGNRHDTPARREFYARNSGDGHWTRRTPGRVKRGSENGAALHPERILRGEDAPSSKLTDDDVRAIRLRRASGETLTSIASDFGVSHPNISAICKLKTWKHVK